MNWPNQQLKALDHCCEEASTSSHGFYIPCNKPAVSIVGWKGRNDAPIRMCEMCAYHNVKNRNGYILSNYGDTAEAQPLKFLNPLDAMTEDELLMLWQKKKDAIAVAKAEEIDLRNYIVKREFPKPSEGTNTKELGNGYQLKAGIKYNYKLADNDTVENCLGKIAALGNNGSFIAERLVSWTPNFLLTEYRQLQEDAEKGSGFAKQALDEVNKMLTITEAAPTLEIKAPKAKK